METTNTTPQKTLSDQWIEVFRAGTHTDSKTRTVTFTRSDLDQIIANHALGAAPAVLGHPKAADPAYAWTSGIKRDGDSLFVKFSEVSPAFDAGVASGAYRNRSVSVYKDPKHGYRLRHVGWLGATPPAIDGLAPVNFSADIDVMEFASPEVTTIAWTLQSIGSVMRRLREYLIAEKGVEEADRHIPNYEINSIDSSVNSLLAEPAAPTNAFSTGDNENMTTYTQEQLDAAVKEATAKAETDAKAAANLEFSKQVEAANQKSAQLEQERRNERIAAQIDDWKKTGKILPAETTGLAEFMAALPEAETFEFSAAGETKSQAPSEWFANFMAAQPSRIELGKKSRQDDIASAAQTPEQLAGQVQEFMAAQAAKGITVSVAEAMAQVSNQ